MTIKVKGYVISYQAHIAIAARDEPHAREIFEAMDEHEMIEHSVVDFDNVRCVREPELDSTFDEED